VFGGATVTVPENSPVDTAVGAPLNASSVLDMTYTITAGNVGGAFKVDACTGQLRVAAAVLDFESRSVYTLTVTVAIAEDPSAFTARTVTVDLVDVNEPPVLLTTAVSVSEIAPVGTNFASLACSDPKNNPCTYAITPGNTGGLFRTTPPPLPPPTPGR
jgi:hypothetical protein